MICVCSIISVISAPYYSEANLHGVMKLFQFRGTLKCTLHLALDGAFCGAAERGYTWILYTVFLNIPLPSVRPKFTHFFTESELCIIYPKYVFQFSDFKLYPRIIILYSVIPECNCQNILGAKLTKQLFVVVMADQI